VAAPISTMNSRRLMDHLTGPAGSGYQPTPIGGGGKRAVPYRGFCEFQGI
jgi:hypothetical protein